MSHKPKICEECPVSNTAKLVGDFWLLLIVRELLIEPQRFTELHEKLHGISRRTLTQKLQKAVQEGLVTRTEFNEAPPRVEYAITPKGKKLKGILREVEKFSQH